MTSSATALARACSPAAFSAVAKALLETEQGRDLYMKRWVEIRRTVFDLHAITNAIAAQASRIRPAVMKDGLAAVAQFESAVQLFRKRGRQHVVGVTPKGQVTPSRIHRPLVTSTESTQASDVLVTDPTGSEGDRQGVAVELRIVPGSRHGPHIDQQIHRVGLE